MKKYLWAVIIGIVVLATSACSQTPTTKPTETEKPTEITTEAETEPETEEIENYLTDAVKDIRNRALSVALDKSENELYADVYIDQFYEEYDSAYNAKTLDELEQNGNWITMLAFFDKNYDINTIAGDIAYLGWASAVYLEQGDIKKHKESLESMMEDMLEVRPPKQTEEEYKASCTDIEFKKLARNPDQYEGTAVKFTGKVFQVIEGDGEEPTAYLISVIQDEYGLYLSDGNIYVTYDGDYPNGRILEDDIVSFYGEASGLYSYHSTGGETITVPQVNAHYIDLIEEGV